MDLDTRLGMLVSSDAISENVASIVRKIIQRLDNNWNISLSEDNGGDIVTNLAMTLMRSNQVGINDFSMYENIDSAKKPKVFPRAIEITEDCIDYAGVNISGIEKEFLETKLSSVLRQF
jgi:hypothetical protein